LFAKAATVFAYDSERQFKEKTKKKTDAMILKIKYSLKIINMEDILKYNK
jgi:hypothetical protein